MIDIKTEDKKKSSSILLVTAIIIISLIVIWVILSFDRLDEPEKRTDKGQIKPIMVKYNSGEDESTVYSLIKFDYFYS